MNNKINVGGLSFKYRELLDKLNRTAKAPFTADEAAKILGLAFNKSSQLLAYWARKGWLTRIRRGLYAIVPLGAVRPEARKEDPWIVAMSVFGSCYIGGWSACEHWDLTEQLFNDVVVFSSKKPKRSTVVVQGTKFIVKKISKKKMFGLKPVWRGRVKVMVSDPEKTIVDILADPAIGGGIRNIAEMLRTYLAGEKKKLGVLMNYVKQYENKTIYKRLGYILEYLDFHEDNLIENCKRQISLGYTKLDPSLPSPGKISRRWMLRINSLQ